MIVLSNYSISWCQNDSTEILFTGELITAPDSVLISFNDLRKANAKMVELKYQKEITDSLRSIIVNDDKIMREYSSNLNALQKQVTQVKRQRNITSWGGIVISLSLAIAFIVK